jgi:hypothetical protein
MGHGPGEAAYFWVVRDVFENPSVSAEVDRAKDRWTRAEDAWDAVVWTISRDPELGEPLTESGSTRALTLDGAQSIDMPTVTVVYDVEESRVTITDAQFEDAAYGQAGTA